MKKLLKAISKAGALEILLYLWSRKEARFTDFQDFLPDALIGLRTKELEALGLIQKEKTREFRPKATYRLSRKGRRLVNLLKQMESLV